jgi:hypothetical protein
MYINVLSFILTRKNLLPHVKKHIDLSEFIYEGIQNEH